MKIALQPTESPHSPNDTSPTVVIDLPFDDLTIDEVMEHLIKPALISYGYLPESIEDFLQKY